MPGSRTGTAGPAMTGPFMAGSSVRCRDEGTASDLHPGAPHIGTAAADGQHVTNLGEDGTEMMLGRISRVAQTRRVVSAAIFVFAVSIGTSFASYAWDWIDALS